MENFQFWWYSVDYAAQIIPISKEGAWAIHSIEQLIRTFEYRQLAVGTGQHFRKHVFLLLAIQIADTEIAKESNAVGEEA